MTTADHRGPRGAVALAGLFLAGLVTATASSPIERTFEADRVGSTPPGFTFTTARQAKPGGWLVEADAGNRFLVHPAGNGGTDGFSIALLEGATLANPRVSVRLKLTGGDRVGGVVWRYADARNFYAVGLDLLQREIALYRVVRGHRIRLEREADLELDPSAWHTIRIVHQENRIRVSLGGVGVFRDRDRTFADPGSVGIWSGGGSTSAFDDLRVEEAERRGSP